MSEKDNKKNKKATEAAESAAKEAAPEAAESAAEAAETTEDTYTVTKAQMEQMEALAKTLADANDKYLRLAAEDDDADCARDGGPVHCGDDRAHQAVSGGAGQPGTGREPI